MLEELLKFRNKIDKIDKLLLRLLAKRMFFVFKIGLLKKKKGLSIVSKKRELSILRSCKIKAKNLGISSKFVQDLLKRIFLESYLIQNF